MDWDVGEVFTTALQIEDGGLQDFGTYPYVLSYSGTTLIIYPLLNVYNVVHTGAKTIHYSVTDSDVVVSGED